MMNTLGDGGTVALKELKAAFTLLTPTQIANMAATNGLSKEWLEGVLDLMKYNDELKKEILAQYSAAQASSAHAGANNALTFGFKNLFVAMKPMLIMAAIAGAAMILYKWFDKLIVTAEEQRDIFNDLQGSYEETKSELSSLGTEIDTVREKLEELNRIEALGGLTASQAEERAELQKTAEELERRIKLLERLEEAKRKGANDAAYETLKKTSYEVTKTTTLDNGYTRHTTEDVGAAEYINHYIEALEDAAERKRKVEEQLASKDKDTLTTDEAFRYEQDIELIEAEITEYEQAISDVITEVQPLLDGITDTSGAAYDQKVAIEAAIDAWVALNDETEDAVTNFENAAIAARQIFPNLTTHVENLKTVEDNVAGLSDALAEFRDDGFVTMDIFSSLAEVFGDFPDEFERFVSVASDSGSTMTEVQSAANSLAEAYLESTDFLNSMTEGTTEATIATLKNMGVMNAEEVVTKRLKIAKAAAALEEAGLTDATWSAIKAHFEAADAAEVDMEAIYALRVEQLNAKIAATDFVTATRDTINALYREAIAVGKATEIWQDYAAALRTKRYLELHSEDLTAGQIEYYNQYLKEYQANIQEKLGDFEVDLDISTSVKPTDSSGKTAAEKAAEEAREAFEKVYNAKKHELDMERITISEFYDWLGGQDGYQKYFEAQGETLEDFRKYSKEVFDGLRQTHDQYLDVLDYEIDVLKRSENVENEVIAKYGEKRAEIQKLIEELRTYLKLEGMSEAEILSNEQYRAYMGMLYSIEDEIKSIQDESFEKTQGYVNDLIDLTEDYIRKVKEDEKEALEDVRDEYEKILDTQKEILNQAREEETYERDKAAKLKQIQKLKERIAALDLAEGDRAAQLEKAELMEQLSELQIELDDFQADHMISTTEDALDEAGESFSDSIDEKIKIIDEFLEDNEAVNKAALEKLDNMNEKLFNNLMDYSQKYTDTTRAEMLAMWDEVTKAAEKYGSVTNASKIYEETSDKNDVQTIVARMRENGRKWATASESERIDLAADSEEQGKLLQEALGVPVWRDKGGTWWIDPGNGAKKLFEIYHTGTPSVGGNASIKQNEVFSLLEKGETVLTKKHMDTMWSVLDRLNPAKWFSSPLSKHAIQTVSGTAEQPGMQLNVSFPMTLYGNMTDATMRVIEKKAYDVADIIASKIRK